MTLDPKALEAARDLIDAFCKETLDTYPPATMRDKLATDILAAPRSTAIVEEPMAQRWHDVDYLMSIIDAAIEDGFDPDEDGPLLDKIRSELKAIPPSPQPHTGRAGVTEALWDALAWIDTFDPETVAAAETKFGIHVGKRALNAALTVEPEAPDDWQLIDTAPRDGTIFWALEVHPNPIFRARSFEAQYEISSQLGTLLSDNDGQRCHDLSANRWAKPTHWRPRPADPARSALAP
jgi:hypothetical protein